MNLNVLPDLELWMLVRLDILRLTMDDLNHLELQQIHRLIGFSMGHEERKQKEREKERRRREAQHGRR